MIKVNITDVKALEINLEAFADSTITANNSGAFGFVEAAAEKAIVHATIEAVAAYLEEQQASAASISIHQAS